MKKIGALLACSALTLGLLAGCAVPASSGTSAAAATASTAAAPAASTETQEIQIIVADTQEEAATVNEAATDNAATSENETTAEITASTETEASTETQEIQIVTTEELQNDTTVQAASDALDPDGSYTTKEDVSLYLYQYGCLPSNFITKKQAKKLGWSGGSLEPYAPGKCIGGDYFGNYEGVLPNVKGEEYHECDIDTLGKKSRGAKRIIYSTDGRIYYTDDHYETFTLLYGEEK